MLNAEEMTRLSARPYAERGGPHSLSTNELLRRYQDRLRALKHGALPVERTAWWEATFDVLRVSLQDWQLSEDEAIQLLTRKHKLYGGLSLVICGEVGVLVRSIDKLCRIINMEKSNLSDADEATKDSMLDLFNYSVLGYLLSVEGGVAPC